MNENKSPSIHYHKGKIDPYELMKSLTSSNNLYIDVLRGDIIKRASRMFDKGEPVLDTKKMIHQCKLLLEHLEAKSDN